LVLESPDYFRLFNITFFTIVIQLSNEIPRALLRIEEKSVLFVTISLFRLIINLTLNIIFIVYSGMGVFGILLGGLISSAAIGVFLVIYILRNMRLAYSFDILRDMLKYSVPLMWSWFGMFVLHFGDRFLLQRLGSLSEVGIYSLAYKFAFIPNLLILGPFQMIWASKRFELIKESNAGELFSNIFTYFMFVFIFISLGMSILIKDVIQIVADSQYHEAYIYIPVLLAAHVFYAAFNYVQLGIHFEKKTRYLAYATLIGGLFNIGMNVLLIPRIHIWGSTLTTLVSWALLTVLTYIPSQKLYHVSYQFGRLLKLILPAVGLFALSTQIDIDSLPISIVVKFILALSYPLILYIIRFYSEDEKRRLAREVVKIWPKIKERFFNKDIGTT
ncbi:MAG: polysaccharide biosynthesis C-terminal domain-containing protein, partial [Candidatus Zixiibacteriota bacterium]